VILAVDTDQDVRGEAMSSLKSWSNEELLTFAADVDTDPKVLSFLLTWTESLESLLPKVLSNPSTPLESLLAVARSFSAGNLDLLLLNQTLLIEHPGLLAELEANPSATPLHRARVEELRRHFFQTAGTAAKTGDHESSIGAPGPALSRSLIESPHQEESGHEGTLTPRARGSAPARIAEVGDPSSAGAPGDPAGIDEHVFAPEGTMQRIFKMNVGEKIQLAQKGTREERTLLIRDSNRSVQEAVLNSPKLTENEVDVIARMRNVNEDILRQIAGHRDWVKTYSVAQALATNPKTPIGIAMNLLQRLTTHDLKVLQTDKNVPEAIRRMARKQVETRANKAGSSKGSGH